MYNITTLYFEFPNPEHATQSFAKIGEYRGSWSSFDLVAGFRPNGSANCLEIDFFPFVADLHEVATALGAVKVTKNFEPLWIAPI